MGSLTPFLAKHKRWLRIVALGMCVVSIVTILTLTAFAQNTYVINVDDQVTVHNSFATDPAQILDEAGVKLNTYDTYTTTTNEGVEQITVQRGMTIYVDDCGNEFVTCSYGETVAQLLKRLSISIDAHEVLLVSLQEQTYDGMLVQIQRREQNTCQYYEEISYRTIECYSPILPADHREVVKEGVNGKMLCTAQLELVNGQEVAQILQSQQVVEAPVHEIVVVGTGENLKGHKDTPAIGDGVIVTAEGKVLYYDKVIQSHATAYHMSDPGCDEWTAMCTRARVGAIAVDPKVIPYFTKMFILSNDGKYVYGEATAEDCGGAIKGTRIDLYYDSVAECDQFGRRDCTVYILREE